jgi:YidC/Oxa1 family membrane protein insertase
MEWLAWALSPIIIAMGFLLETLYAATRNYGISIILLSCAVRLSLSPITRLATRTEQRTLSKQRAMAPQLAEIDASSKGRERFARTEQIYKEHGYHPIQNATAILPVFLQVPFLLAALFLLSNDAQLANERFLLIRDLLRPDMLIGGDGWSINALPIVITVVALGESEIKHHGNRSARARFLVVALVIALLIYAAPAGVCLYWLTSNLLSFGRTALARRPKPNS